ncbi:TIM23 complex component [Agyrium rufum]|nr:TIM23 complex component [Agyrium rufum]
MTVSPFSAAIRCTRTVTRMAAKSPQTALFRAKPAPAAPTSSKSCIVPADRSRSFATIHPRNASRIESQTMYTTFRNHTRTLDGLASSRRSQQIRHSSSTAPTASPAASSPITSSSTPVSSPSPTAPSSLTWNEFLALRRKRRLINTGSSAVLGTMTLITGAAWLSTVNVEAMAAQAFNLDPFLFVGLATATCGAGGWLLGPVLGNAIFKILWRGRIKDIQAKEKSFYDRIRRFRIDPSSSSVSNPVPDYYGEKIGSVSAYRQWLKDQRAFMKKRESY